MTIHRVTLGWTGFQGAPGYSNFFFEGAADSTIAYQSVQRVMEFAGALASVIPEDVSWVSANEVDNIDEVTGALEGYAVREDSVSYDPPTAGGSYSAPSGAVINWLTETVARGRRLRGRTFLVPLANSAYQSDGTLSSSALTTIRSAAELMIFEPGDSSFGIWSRPRNGAGGVFGEVVAAQVPDMAAVLRSRRD